MVLVVLIYSSKISDIRFPVEKVSMVILLITGGATSFGPPVGLTGFAHDIVSKLIYMKVLKFIVQNV